MAEKRQLKFDEIEKVLEQHLAWILKGYDGPGRADLSNCHIFWNQLDSADLREADMHESEFEQASLRGARLSGANLRGSDFSSANLKNADLSGADLCNANLTLANLSGANLKGADLRNAELSKAGLTGANFTGAALENVNLAGARCYRTTFANNDLSKTKGLEFIVHDGPSSVGVDTLFKSKGQIPNEFLRGCGVPETLIDYLPAHIQSLDLYPYYTCFISYCEADEKFSKKLYDDLQARKIRCWRWREDAKWGESLRGEIDDAVREYDKLVVICSKDSLNSRPVQEEIERALQKEQEEDREVLFPIRIDDYVFGAWESEYKANLKKKVLGKFPKSGRGKDYDEAIGRLVEGLKRGCRRN